jgi:outer membrane protein, multidrug efflux system
MLFHRFAFNSLFIAALALAAGCAVGPNFKRPPADAPETFRGAPILAATNSLGDLPWWDVFQDEALRELMRVAITNNYDLRIAIARVEQSRAILEQNRGLFFPQLDYGGSIGRGRNSSGNQAVFTGRRANGELIGGPTANNYAIAGNASWEIDLWGRIRRLNESARAQLLASEEARRDVMITLLSEVATAYFQLLALDQQLQIAHRSTNSFGESLRIFSQRFQGGIVSKLETSAAEAVLASAAATVPDFERQIVITENRLDVLLGTNPAPIQRGTNLVATQFPLEVPPGLPSALVERRPDIREAEQTYRSANAQIGAAIADFFPRLSLTALLGQVSPELSAFTGGAANAWGIAGNLAGPLFHGGQLVGRYREQRALAQEAQLRYRSAVINAFQEVSNALVSREKYAEAAVQQDRAVKAYQEAVQVATERYVAGRAGYFEVLQEQQQLFPAENNLVQIQLNERLSFIQLYRALGGGWEREALAENKGK